MRNGREAIQRGRGGQTIPVGGAGGGAYHGDVVGAPDEQPVGQRALEDVVDAAADALPGGLLEFGAVADDQILETVDPRTRQLLVQQLLVRHAPIFVLFCNFRFQFRSTAIRGIRWKC